jgi:hypothetical protein
MSDSFKEKKVCDNCVKGCKHREFVCMEKVINTTMEAIMKSLRKKQSMFIRIDRDLTEQCKKEPVMI